MCQFRLVIGCDDDAGAAIRSIGIGEARHHGNAHDRGFGFHCCRAGVHQRERFIIAARALRRQQQGGAGIGRCRDDLSPEQARHDFDRFDATRMCIDMWIGIVSQQHARHFDQMRTDIAVHVQQDDDRRLNADDAAHARDDVGFDIELALRYHRAVQRQQDTVYGKRLAQAIKQVCQQHLIGVARDRSSGHGCGVDRRQQLPASAGRRLDHAADAGARAVHFP